MDFCKLGIAVIETEAKAISQLSARIDQNFDVACEILLACKGRIVTTGMGKSGYIAQKIAATLSSTGSPAFYMHPGEAIHGDLGMITRQDTVLAFSNSGSTPEMMVIIPIIKRLEIPLITLTGSVTSPIAQAAHVNLDVSISHEACPLGLTPTTSTTVSLVMGDALAIALLQARGFSAQDFALSHPGGIIGKRLLLHIDELLHTGDELPLVQDSVTIRKALLEVSAKKLGMTCVINDQGALVGIYSDGDVRRTLNNFIDIDTTEINQVMTKNCRTVKPGLLAAEALALMQKHSITALIVTNDESKPIGVLHLHDLLRAGVY